MLCSIHHARNITWKYQAALGTCCRPYRHYAERSSSSSFRRWIRHEWRSRRDHAHGRWQASPTRANLMCIHGGEGSWDANTGNGYYGGLQMDMPFQGTYGPEFLHEYGTADRWPPLEQLTAGARAVRVRGYGPWPLTRQPCGV